MASKEQLFAFTKTYGIQLEGETRIAIDWPKVASEYQGVMITPFFTEYDDLFWYGAWGYASGCIWDKAAISGIGRSRDGDPFEGLEHLPSVSFE